MYADEATVIARPHPFSQTPSVVAVKAGRTIQQILDDCRDGYELASTLRVEINGYEVPAELWQRVKPKAGTKIALTVMPAGGGGSGNKWLRLVLMVVVIVVAWYVAPIIMGTSAGAALAGMGVTTAMVASGLTMIGMALVNALVPPPQPKLSGPQEAPERQFALTGTSNQVNQYGVIPLVLGEMRYFPPHAALPYTENVGSAQYIRMMLDLGHGDIDVSDIRIGETPIDSYDEVEYEITTTPTLYSDDVYEDAVGATLDDGNVVTRTSQVQADELGVIINFNGLYGGDKKGKIVQATANITFEYRLVGSGTWLAAPITTRKLNWSAGTVKTANRDPFTVAVSWIVPASGQYEVRITRGATAWGAAEANSRQGAASVYALRTTRKTNPSTTGTNKLCLRIKATDQLNGAVQTLNVLQRQSIPVWTGAAWVNQYSRNPAWVAHWLMRHCPAIKLHATDAMIDLDALEEFADYCTARELECSMVVDSATTLLELVSDVFSAGMATRGFRDGKISVVWDKPDQQPVGVFTPNNSNKFAGQRSFFEMPHGLRVKFTNPDAGYITDEIIVLDDGYSHRGLDARGIASALPAASRFEQMDLKACRGAQAAWRAGRHQMGQAKFRPSNYSLETDIEMIRHTRGDLVTVMDDVVEWGEGWGRIKSIAGNTVTLDEVVTFTVGTTYYAQFRCDDGSIPDMACTPAGTETNTFTVASLPGQVKVGDVVALGSAIKQTRDMLVTAITPGQDLMATIKLVDYAPALFDYIDNPPDTILSEATGLTYLDPPDPPRITVILSGQGGSAPDDAGVTTPSVTLGVGAGGAAGSYVRQPPWRDTRSMQ
jgi:predicted phage tail protein